MNANGARAIPGPLGTGIHTGTAGHAAPCIYLVDAPEHPTNVSALAGSLACTLVTVPVDTWGARLTPWPASALYRGEPDYAGGAPDTLTWLIDEVMPQVELQTGLAPRSRGVAGYSLGGLFALYAFAHDPRFSAVACLSGSLWYEGWLEHLEQLDIPTTGRYGFFSLGSKERRAARPQLKTVEERTRTCIGLLRTHGLETDFVLNPGGHLSHVDERICAGIQALDAFFGRAPANA